MYQNQLACTWKSAVVLGSMVTMQWKGILFSTDLAHGIYRCWFRIGFLSTLISNLTFEFDLLHSTRCNTDNCAAVRISCFITSSMLVNVESDEDCPFVRAHYRLFWTLFAPLPRNELENIIDLRILSGWKSRKTHVCVVPINEKHHPSPLWATDFTFTSN